MIAEEAQARLGTRLGNYALREIIGLGGMGVVYRATHIYIRKPAAVKVLYRHFFEQPGAKARFLREAQAASLIDHPNIVSVSDFGEAPDGTMYIVMAEASGVGLDEVLADEGTLPLLRALGILNQVTQALGVAHAQGVVHRDLKPENLMLARREGRREIVRDVREDDVVVERIEPEGSFDFVTILDFGAAGFIKHVPGAQAETGNMIGTPAYMAPETAREGVADARSDIYSVGVIFYEMLTGTVPFDGERPVDVMMKHVNEIPEPPRSRNPYVEITAAAGEVILRALAKDPAQRHASMSELAADLQRCYGSMRFRRSNAALGSGLALDTIRNPMRRFSPPSRPVQPEACVDDDGITPPPQVVVHGPAGSPGPIVLTTPKRERKSG